MRIVRAIIIGALTGAALFFLPFFILRGFLFILFIALVIRVVAFGRLQRSAFGGRGLNPLFAEKIRSMSDEEYNNFKQNFYDGCRQNPWHSNKPEREKTAE